jgi:hypothetical protein
MFVWFFFGVLKSRRINLGFLVGLLGMNALCCQQLTILSLKLCIFATPWISKERNIGLETKFRAQVEGEDELH